MSKLPKITQHAALVEAAKLITTNTRVHRKNTNWHELVEAISAKYTVRNWTIVRNALQSLISTRLVVRTNSVSSEAYSLTRAAVAQLEASK
jgi:UDP-galactopyranose mutase